MIDRFKFFLKQKFPALIGLYRKVRFFFAKVFNINKGKAIVVKESPQLLNDPSTIAVAYLTPNYPKQPPVRQEYAHGGLVKTIYLAEKFHHSFPEANILYAISSVGSSPSVIASAKKRKIKIVVNQNGVAYPAWHGAGWEKTNLNLKALIDQADFIIYQSQFCKLGAERFLSPPKVPSGVIYNPVDTTFFSPRAGNDTKHQTLTLLLGGNQNERYRFELAVQTLKAISLHDPNVKLIVTGHLWRPYDGSMNFAKNLLQDLKLTDNVIFAGAYSQQQAPELFNQAHVLLHTQYNDASPTLVLEAMASGLPVVYLDCGGTPELVADAGIGVPVEQSWEQIYLPAPEELGNAVLQIMSQYREFSSRARERAVTLFSLEVFIEKHRQIFERLLIQ